MSEYLFSYVFCDRCYPDKVPDAPILYPGSPEKCIPGIYWGSFQEAQVEGWVEVDYGHVCPTCAVEDGQEVAECDNMVLGREAWSGSMDYLLEDTDEQADETAPLDRGVTN